MAGSPLFLPIADDFRLSTWLAIGACLYAALGRVLPPWLVIYVPVSILALRIAQTLLVTQGILAGSSNTIQGRYTTKIPASARNDNSIVVFILGARINHPLGRLAPGFLEAGKIFTKMWRECGTNREKYGFLGKTSTLMGSQEHGGMTMVWITYWKNLEGLRDFAASDAHRALQMPWLAKTYPYLGIMHETYHVPKGDWETIYLNFQPFGMGKTKYVVEPSTSNVETLTERNQHVSPLVQASGRDMRSMFSRMGKHEDIALAGWNPEMKDISR